MNDFRMFDIYRKANTVNYSHEEYCDVDHLLRFWREGKGQYLQGIFGDKLILEKQITYNKPKSELQNDMCASLQEHWEFLESIMNRLADVMNVNTYNRIDETSVSENVWRCMRSSLLGANSLVENYLNLGYVYDKKEQEYKDINSYTIDFGDGKKIQVQRGMKTIRAFTQICKALGMSEEWEKFRIMHSQVLNTKKLTGTLCLSIHPLDYATASDNDNGWSSCMSWQENGCYRMGTVEMMNSPMVICAYLKSAKQHMEIGGEEWNSKKWRAWIIVTKDLIISNRHYPYHHDEMAINCIEWVKDLVKEKYGWEYDDTHTDFISWMHDVGYSVEFYTNYMYNDIGSDDIIGCYRKDWKPRTMPGFINFSGPAECMVCGEYIHPDAQDAGKLECAECNAEFRCSECGAILDEDEDEIYYDPDGNMLCSDCYNEIYTNCSFCEDTVRKDEVISTCFPLDYKNIDSAKYQELKQKLVEHGMRPLCFDFDMIMRHKPSTTRDVIICPNCMSRYGVTQVAYIFKNVNSAVKMYGPDPSITWKSRWFHRINAPGYDAAVRTLDAIEQGRSTGYYLDEKLCKEYFKFIKDFWDKQWKNYVNNCFLKKNMV